MFSVVIPLYNKEKSIGNTIQSVLNQTLQDFEIVVVNDGSTDNSLQVVEKINDSRIRIINKPNGGVSSARNRGIKEAKYAWIAFLDGDDLWKPNHLSVVYQMLKSFPDKCFFSTSFSYLGNSKLSKNAKGSDVIIIEDYFKESLNDYLVNSTTAVVNKKCFDDVGFFDINYGEDLDMWARIASKYQLVKSFEITSIYRLNAENRSDISHVSVRKTFINNIDFNNIKNKYEYEYYRLHIINRIKSYIVKKEWSNLYYLLYKYNFKLLKRKHIGV
jgi:glycosyltransferase involved in cell wall biosynthesis